MCHNLGFEEHVEAVNRRVRHTRFHQIDVVGETVHVAQIRHSVLVTGIGVGFDGQDVRIEILPVRQPAAIQPLIDAGLDLTAEIIRRGADDVIARVAGHHFGLERLIRIVGVVDDFYARGTLEIRQRALADVVRPVIDVQHLLFVTGRAETARRMRVGTARADHGGDHRNDQRTQRRRHRVLLAR